MTGKTHKIGGLCGGVMTTVLMFDGPFSKGLLSVGVPLIVMSVVGSLLPDIDHAGSTIGKKLKLISYPISRLFGHRGVIHSPFVALLLALLLQLGYISIPESFQPMYFGFSLGLFIGYVSHLILDFLTVSGIPLLAPISSKKHRLMKLKTGKHENFVILMLTIMTTATICICWM